MSDTVSEDTSTLLLCARVPDSNRNAFAQWQVSWQTAATLGLIHLLLYVAFILLVPVSLITAGLLLVWKQWAGRQRTFRQEPATSIVTSNRP